MNQKKELLRGPWVRFRVSLEATLQTRAEGVGTCF